MTLLDISSCYEYNLCYKNVSFIVLLLIDIFVFSLIIIIALWLLLSIDICILLELLITGVLIEEELRKLNLFSISTLAELKVEVYFNISKNICFDSNINFKLKALRAIGVLSWPRWIKSIYGNNVFDSWSPFSGVKKFRMKGRIGLKVKLTIILKLIRIYII